MKHCCDDLHIGDHVLSVRPIAITDVDRLARMFTRLSPESVHVRFVSPIAKPPRAALLRLADVDHDRRDALVAMLGDEIVEKIGPVWGMDKGGEMANMYKPTPQKGLWFIGGGFAQSRVWSHYVAMQIKAREAGIIEDSAVEKPELDTLTGPPYQPLEHALPPQAIEEVGAVVSIWIARDFVASMLFALSQARNFTVVVAETVNGPV